MNCKFPRMFCAITLPFLICSGYNNCCNASGTPPQATYSQATYSGILDNMDRLVVNVFDDDDSLLTDDGMLIAQAHWAIKIMDIFTSRDLTRHWLDSQPANLSIIREIFEESFHETLEEHPELQPYLTNPATRQSMRIELGLA